MLIQLQIGPFTAPDRPFLLMLIQLQIGPSQLQIGPFTAPDRPFLLVLIQVPRLWDSCPEHFLECFMFLALNVFHGMVMIGPASPLLPNPQIGRGRHYNSNPISVLSST